MFYKYRFLLQNLIQRDIKVKYRRSTLGILWSVFLLIIGMMTIHEYSFGQAVGAIIMTVIAMAVILFIMLLAVTLFMQVYNIFKSIFSEILYRM